MAKVDFADLSGTTTPVTPNPFDGLLQICNQNPSLIQDRYQQHRVTRNAQQKAKILADDFPGWILDDTLVKLEGPKKDPNFTDPRNCLVFWGRPPQKVKALIEVIQQKLKDAAPDMWLMPLSNLHITVMEVTHSLTSAEIDALVTTLKPFCQPIADYTQDHRARLIKPMLSYDAAALALSFVPANGEVLTNNRTAADDDYTYHHLRRDIYHQVTNAGVPVGSRYVVPSAHLTIARFNTPNVFGGDELDAELGKTLENRKRWIREIEMINKWLEAEFWPQEGAKNIRAGGEWVVGEEKGLDFRKGRLWYGDGETVYIGKGASLAGP